MTRKIAVAPLDLTKDAVYVGPSPYRSPSGAHSVLIVAGEKAGFWFTNLLKSLPRRLQKLVKDRQGPGRLTYWVIPDQHKAKSVSKTVRELFRKAVAKLNANIEVLAAKRDALRLTLCATTI